MCPFARLGDLMSTSIISSTRPRGFVFHCSVSEGPTAIQDGVATGWTDFASRKALILGTATAVLEEMAVDLQHTPSWSWDLVFSPTRSITAHGRRLA